jgi:hypothetical protein
MLPEQMSRAFFANASELLPDFRKLRKSEAGYRFRTSASVRVHDWSPCAYCASQNI